MSIDNIKVVDFTGVDKESGDVILTISDHLPWTDSISENRNHLNLLEGKINTYLQFIESGQLVEDYPDAKGKKVVINVVGKFTLNYDAIIYFEKAEKVIANAGFKLSFQLFENNKK
jgi:hypothetical protein